MRSLPLWLAAVWAFSLTTLGLFVVPMLFANLPTPAMAGGMAAGMATGTAIGIAVAGPVGVVVGATLGAALENARLLDETQHLLKETEARNAELQAQITELTQWPACSRGRSNFDHQHCSGWRWWRQHNGHVEPTG